MKKFLTVLLAVVMVFTMASICVNAEGEAKNYLTAEWGTSGQVKVASVEKDGDSYVCSGFKNAWDSPTVDIFDAIKNAIGEEDEVTVLIKANFKIKWADSANEGSTASFRPLLRAGASKDEEWNDKYAEYCDEQGVSNKLFTNSSGNIMCSSLGGALTLTDSEETEFEVELTVEKGVLSTDFFASGWQLCFDNIKSDTGEITDIESLICSNTAVYIADEYYEANATPTPEPTPTPTATPEATPTPQATATPAATATATAANKTGDKTGSGSTTADAESNNNGLIIGIIIAVVVVAVVAVVVVVVVKKKGDAPADAPADDKKSE